MDAAVIQTNFPQMASRFELSPSVLFTPADVEKVPM